MAFGLQPTGIYTSCHTYQCYNTATHFLGHPDSPNGTVYYLCDQCAGELKEQVISAHLMDATKDIPSALTFEDVPESVEVEAKATFEEMTVAELKSFCREAGVTGYSDKTKDEIIELLRNWDETV